MRLFLFNVFVLFSSCFPMMTGICGSIGMVWIETSYKYKSDINNGKHLKYILMIYILNVFHYL